MFDLADKARRDLGEIVGRDRHLLPVDDVARRVQRRRRNTEHDFRAVRLGRILEKAQQARGATSTDEQYSGCVGIERARVTNPALSVRLAQLGHDVVGCPTGGLVDDDQAVVHGHRTYGNGSASASEL